ncbi:MAG TPA: clostripain-related cysteine peptidase [Pyrinomonadaceae bacterium]|nr:clostripain-related cysteine peptidase [Pyrinomonadaceae bacterium]
MPDSVKSDRKVTVMCFFASDNNLSPLLISQVKAIKDAGYEENTDVLLRFDPNEPSAPTRVYHVNNKRREAGRRTVIGDGENPFVRNMAEDIIDPNEIDISSKPKSAALKNELTGDVELSPFESLQNFIAYSLENYPAKHYVLFLIGHGMIVGNDAFLPDDNPNGGISLKQLEEILKPFKTEDGGSTLELLGLHSCSMSSVEIACQLQGLANYMIAQQATSFVGSWPYRQLLKRIFRTVDEAKDNDLNDLDIQKLVEKLYLLSLYNSTDFMMAGYSSEMALCNLRPDVVKGLTESLQRLIYLLIDALGRAPDGNVSTASSQNGDKDPVKELIVSLVGRAHSESQSYWGERYTDLYDFCDCLGKACQSVNRALVSDQLKEVIAACEQIKKKLETVSSDERLKRFENLVVRSEYFGGQFQHSHGLSIYFPWSEPLEVENVEAPPVTAARQPGTKRAVQPPLQSIMDRYQEYKFTEAFDSGFAWSDFLRSYFAGTQRSLRNDQPSAEVLRMVGLNGQAEVASTSAAAVTSFLPGGDHKSTGEQGDCSCPSIKNFHTEPGRNGLRIRAFSISAGALKAFKEPVADADIAQRPGERTAEQPAADQKAAGRSAPR